MLLLDASYEPIEINTSVEWLECLLVVGLSVELEYLDVESLDVLQLQGEMHFFVHSEAFFVRFQKAHDDFLLNTLVLLGVYLQAR